MTSDTRSCVLLGAVLLACALLLYISFHKARNEADELISAFQTDWERESQRLQVFFSITGNHCLASWEFANTPVNSFVTHPFTIQVTFTGEAVASNPSDGVTKLKALRKKQKDEAAKRELDSAKSQYAPDGR